MLHAHGLKPSTASTRSICGRFQMPMSPLERETATAGCHRAYLRAFSTASISVSEGARQSKTDCCFAFRLPLPTAKVLPSGENITSGLLSPYSVSVSVSRLVATFHNLTVLSLAPVAMVFPSGENATEIRLSL